MFTILLDRQTDILNRLLDMYIDGINVQILDITYGTGSLWKKVNNKICVKCDREPNNDKIIKRDIMIDEYNDLGKFRGVVFDPPYLIGRAAYDYSGKVNKDGSVVPTSLQGKNSWNQNNGIKKYVANPTIEHFNERVRMVNKKIPGVLEKNGYLFVKVMDVRHKGKLIPNHVTIINELTNFDIECIFIYIKQGSTTWTIENNGQTLHGYWLVFKLKDNYVVEKT